MEITVGQVSGIIAAAIFAIQHILPNLIILILVGVLRNQHTAVTWSVVQRHLLSSSWPTWLRSDANASNGVNSTVKIISLLSPLSLGLVAIAAIVTPLGLYDAIIPSDEFQSVPFLYLRDNGPMGRGTPPQNTSVLFTRECTSGFSGLAACPGSDNVVITVPDDTGLNTDTQIEGIYDMSIPEKTQNLFQSGLKNQPDSVSSFFDIRSRQYTYRTEKDLQGGKTFTVSIFRMLQSLILDDKIEPVQGLIVDMKHGGIGFRNHTVPAGISQGAEWTEDLLWMEPMTECVNTNVSLEFQLGDGSSLSSFDMQNVQIVDEGGFANLIQEYPKLNMDDNQSNPKLRERAYKAAWVTNTFNMLFMNITRPKPNSFAYLNSEVGKKFPLAKSSSKASANGIFTSSLFSSLLDPTMNALTTSNSSLSNTTSTRGLYSNPFNVQASNFSDVDVLCRGVGGLDYANSSNIYVTCGMFFGAAERVDGVSSLIFEPNSTWRQSVYTCASLNKVSIKEVSFRYNATLGSDLSALNVTGIADKKYEKDEDMPLWGMETPGTSFAVSDIQQLWGLISEDQASSANLSTKRAPELYLPGYKLWNGLTAGVPGSNYIPAVTLPQVALGATYELSDTSVNAPVFDYTGSSNLNLFSRWQEMSKNESTLPHILHLVWTDIMANSVQGTRGWDSSSSSDSLSKRDGSGDSKGASSVPVRVYQKRIQYHWAYAIPAFLSLAVFLAILLGASCFTMLRGSPKRVRHYLDHLSAGRILAAEQYPGQSSKTAPTNVWIAQVGKFMVNVVQPYGEVTHVQQSQDYPPPQPGYPGGPYPPEKDGVYVSATATGVQSYPLSPMDPNRVYHQGHGPH